MCKFISNCRCTLTSLRPDTDAGLVLNCLTHSKLNDPIDWRTILLSLICTCIHIEHSTVRAIILIFQPKLVLFRQSVFQAISVYTLLHIDHSSVRAIILIFQPKFVLFPQSVFQAISAYTLLHAKLPETILIPSKNIAHLGLDRWHELVLLVP
jgi:hypothetical protein